MDKSQYDRLLIQLKLLGTILCGGFVGVILNHPQPETAAMILAIVLAIVGFSLALQVLLDLLSLLWGD